MAHGELPSYQRAYRFVLDVANGRHPLSNVISSGLLFLEAFACSLIIAKVPCKLKLPLSLLCSSYGR